MFDNPIAINQIIQRALLEDIGSSDVTTEAIVDPKRRGKAELLAKEDIVLAGLPVFVRVFRQLSSEMGFEHYFRDGERVPAGERISLISGPVSAMLQAERTALNFLQRMSGIATLARKFVDRIGTRKVRIVDTRKTVPGLRLLDKYAVRMGGGANHRLGLFDGVLIKDNHIAAAGSIKEAIDLARDKVPHTLKIEVEVEDLDGVKAAVDAGADVVLLDNMSPAIMKEAVKLTEGRVMLEASGNINMDNIEEVAQTGVHIISIGALTHSVRAVDLSLEIIPDKIV